jgi:hypothetical protein
MKRERERKLYVGWRERGMRADLRRRLVSVLVLGGVLFLSGNRPVWPGEKMIADYGGTSGFQSPIWAAKVPLIPDTKERPGCHTRT